MEISLGAHSSASRSSHAFADVLQASRSSEPRLLVQGRSETLEDPYADRPSASISFTFARPPSPSQAYNVGRVPAPAPAPLLLRPFPLRHGQQYTLASVAPHSACADDSVHPTPALPACSTSFEVTAPDQEPCAQTAPPPSRSGTPELDATRDLIPAAVPLFSLDQRSLLHTPDARPPLSLAIAERSIASSPPPSLLPRGSLDTPFEFSLSQLSRSQAFARDRPPTPLAMPLDWSEFPGLFDSPTPSPPAGSRLPRSQTGNNGGVQDKRIVLKPGLIDGLPSTRRKGTVHKPRPRETEIVSAFSSISSQGEEQIQQDATLANENYAVAAMVGRSAGAHVEMGGGVGVMGFEIFADEI